MQQDFPTEEIQLKYQAERIECPKHNCNIISLNIGQNATERLLCQDCQCLGQTVLILNQADNLLSKWYQEEKQSIQDEKQKYERLTTFFLQSISEIEIAFTKLVRELKNKIEKLNQANQELVTQHKQSNLKTIIKTLSCTEYLDYRTLEEVAEFFSKQQLVDGQLVLKEKLNFNTPLHLKVKGMFQNVLEHFHKLQTALGKPQDWEQQYQEIKAELQFEASNLRTELSQECFHFVNPIQLKGHKEDISAVNISNDNKFMATADQDGLIILWNAQNQSKIRQYQAKQNKIISDLAFSSNSKFLAASQLRYYHPSDLLIYLLESNQTTPQMKFKKYQSSSLKLQFTNDCQFLISASTFSTLTILDLEQSCTIVSKDLELSIRGVTISANSRFIACCCDSGYVSLFESSNIRDAKEIIKWRPHLSTVTCTQFTEDSAKIVTCGNDKSLKIWVVNSLFNVDFEKEPLQTISCEQDIKKFNLLFHDTAIIVQEQILKFIDLKSQKLIYSLGDQYSIMCYATNSEMKFILLGMEKGKLKLYLKPGH